jgi:hypothetical protein
MLQTRGFKENSVKQDRIRNILLTVVAVLLFFNLVVSFAHPVHAAGKVQYRVMSINADFHPRMGASTSEIALEEQKRVEMICNDMSSLGWEYVGSVGSQLIFKR